MPRKPLLHRLQVQSVVVFRALHFGDMLCAVPALRALRMAVPKAHIALAGLPWAAQFVHRFSSYLDEFLVFPGHPLLPEQNVQHDDLTPFYATVCAREFSLALQLHGSSDLANNIVAGFGAAITAGHCRGKPVVTDKTVLASYPETGAEPERLLHLVGQLGAPAVGKHLEFPVLREDEDELAASGLTAGLEPGSYLCVHPGARDRATCWPPQRFAAVADRLAGEFGLRIVLTGSPDEAPLTQAVAGYMHTPALVATAPMSLGAMAALLRDARLLVCNDTGVSHLAAGLGLNSVVIFRKADIARWAPLDRQRHRCIWDPAAERTAVVLQHARALLTGAEPGGQRAAGMWPYW